MAVNSVALIGYGYWGKKLYKYLTESPRFNLKLIYFRSLSDKTDEQISLEYGHKFVGSLEGIWKDASILSVVIATPVGSHFELTKLALENNKNVFVEKPMAQTFEDCNHLMELAKNRGLKLSTEYTYTFSKALKKAQCLVEEGAIGALEGMQILIKQMGRFLPYDITTLLGSHALSILDMFFPLDRCGFTLHPIQMTEKRNTGVIITFVSESSNFRGTIDITSHCPVREKRVIIYGEKGTIIYDPMKEDCLQVTQYARTPYLREMELFDGQQSFQYDENQNLKNAVDYFADSLETENLTNAVSASRVTQVLQSLGAQ
jgi:predicted dehydrogenase